MHRSSDIILAMVETGSTMRFLLNPLLFLPRPESQPRPWLNLLLLLRQNFLSAYCVLIHNLTDADPPPSAQPAHPQHLQPRHPLHVAVAVAVATAVALTMAETAYGYATEFKITGLAGSGIYT